MFRIPLLRGLSLPLAALLLITQASVPAHPDDNGFFARLISRLSYLFSERRTTSPGAARGGEVVLVSPKGGTYVLGTPEEDGRPVVYLQWSGRVAADRYELRIDYRDATGAVFPVHLPTVEQPNQVMPGQFELKVRLLPHSEQGWLWSWRVNVRDREETASETGWFHQPNTAVRTRMATLSTAIPLERSKLVQALQAPTESQHPFRLPAAVLEAQPDGVLRELMLAVLYLHEGFTYEAMRILHRLVATVPAVRSWWEHLRDSGVASFEPALNNGNLLAVIIGISDYERSDPNQLDTGLPDLPRAVPEAEAFRDFLVGYVSARHPDFNAAKNVFYLTEKDAKAAAIRGAFEVSLRNRLNEVQDDATLVVYFAGHGYREGADLIKLIPYDGGEQNGRMEGVTLDEIYALLRQHLRRLKHAIFFVDACYSGGLIYPFSDFERALKNRRPDVFVLCASSAKENARENVFSPALLAGLSGKLRGQGPGILTARQLYAKVLGDVVDKNSQQEVRYWTTSPDVPVIEVAAPAVGRRPHRPIPSSVLRPTPAGGHVLRSGGWFQLLPTAFLMQEAEADESHSELLTQATMHRRAARYADAVSLLRQTADLASQQGNQLTHIAALDLLGEVYQEIGHYGAAERAFREATELRVAAPIDSRVTGRLALARGHLNELQALRVRQERKLLFSQEAPNVSRTPRGAQAQQPLDVGTVLSVQLAFAERASSFYQEALKSATGTARAAAHLGLGRVLRMLGNGAEAERNLREAVELARNDLALQGEVLLVLGLTAVEAGDADAALPFFQRADEAFADPGLVDLRWRVQHGLARARMLKVQTSGRQVALEAFERAVQRLEELRSRLLLPPDSDLQEFVALRRPLYFDYVDALLANSDRDKAFELLERYHSHWSTGPIRVVDRPATATEARQIAEQTGTALLCYLSGLDRLDICAVVPRQGVTWSRIRLTSGELADLISTARSGGTISPERRKVEPTALLLDRQDRLWLGTRSSGLFYRESANHGSWIEALPAGGLIAGGIHALGQDTVGRLWIAAGRGCVIYEPELRVARPVSGPGSPEGQELRSVWCDASGNVFIGSRQGVYILDGRGWQFVESRDPVRALQTDQSGTLWVGTEAGLISCTSIAGRWQRQARYSGQKHFRSSDLILSLHTNPAGVWCGTPEGLVLLDAKGNRLRFWEERPAGPLPDDDVIAIAEDSRGVLWVATEGGLAAYDSRAGTWRGNLGVDAPRGADGVQALVTGIPRSAVAALTARGIHYLREPERPLVWELEAIPASASGTQVRTSLERLHRILLPPEILKVLNADRISHWTIVADATTALVPFPALMHNGRFLVYDQPIVHAAAVAHLRGPERALRRGRPLVMMRPELPVTVEDPLILPAPQTEIERRAFERRISVLLQNAMQGNAGMPQFDQQQLVPLTGRSASEASLKQHAKDLGFLLLDAPMVSSEGKPVVLLSAGGGENGFVTEQEVAALPLGGAVVAVGIRGRGTPSAQETLTRALHLAGAPAVVLSVLPTQEDLLLQLAYTTLVKIAEDRPLAQALAEAQRRIAREYPELDAWAGFRLVVGSGR